MLDKDLLAKLRKLNSIADKTSGANDFERITAQGLIDKLLKPTGHKREDLPRLLAEDDAMKKAAEVVVELIQLNCNSKLERKIAIHCVMTVLGYRAGIAAYKRFSKQRMYFLVPTIEASKIEQLFLEMRKQFRRQTELLLTAFIQKNNLFGKDHENKGKAEELTPEEQELLNKLYQVVPQTATKEEIYRRVDFQFSLEDMGLERIDGPVESESSESDLDESDLEDE